MSEPPVAFIIDDEGKHRWCVRRPQGSEPLMGPPLDSHGACVSDFFMTYSTMHIYVASKAKENQSDDG